MNNKLIDIKRTVPKHYNPIKIVRSVYCEVAFLLQIQHLLELPKAPLDRTVLDSQLDMIVHLLVDFDLYLDIPDNVATQLSSNSNVSEFTGIRCLLHKIAQKRAGLTRSVRLCGQSHFVPITQINEHLTSQSLNAIYLTSLDAETCKQVENDYGIVAIRYDEKQEKFTHSNFFQLSLLNTQVKKRDLAYDWQFLTNMNLKSNSLVWVDGYILKDDLTIEYNVKPILKKILPDKLVIPYIITFITNYPPRNDPKNRGTFSENDPQDTLFKLREIKETIVQVVHELKGEDYNFRVNVCNMNGCEHDRWILTNNQYITSGAGFDLIYKNRNGQSRYSKSTNVYGSCIYSNAEDRKDYEALCQRLARMRQEDYEWIDDSQNRTF